MPAHLRAHRRGVVAAAALLAGCAGSGGWKSTQHRDHPLVGRAWSVADGRFVELAAVEAAVARADLVLLGETHDNPDHHALQARMLRAAVDAGRRPAVAFEMLDVNQQDAVDRARAAAPRDPDAIAEAVKWSSGGWPEFALYRPIFAIATEAGLPIVAANLSRKQVREVVQNGIGVLPERVQAMLERQPPLSEAARRALRQEMAASHCGELPDSMLDPMVEMQRARDAILAERMLSAADGRGAVLIAGAGHVRNDRAVPAYLAPEAGQRTIRAVAFLEVLEGRTTPDAYADEESAGRLPFDFVVFTPGLDRGDPCEGLRQHKPSPPPAEPRPPSTSGKDRWVLGTPATRERSPRAARATGG